MTYKISPEPMIAPPEKPPPGDKCPFKMNVCILCNVPKGRILERGGFGQMGGNLLANYGEAVAMILFGIGFSNLLLQKENSV